MDDSIGWLVAFGVCFVAYRVLFRSSDSPSPSSGSRRAAIPQAQVDQVAAVLPHLSQSSIRYALEGSRGNVAMVVERGLRQGGLQEPPAGYFPDPSPRPSPVTAAPPSSAPNPSSSSTPASLIQRLGLQSRTAEPDSDEIEGKGKGKARAGAKWETTTEARESSLRQRKERMVLEARRKLLEKEKAKAGAKSGSYAA